KSQGFVQRGFPEEKTRTNVKPHTCRQGVAAVPARRPLMFDATTRSPNSHDLFKEPAWRWLRCGYLLDHGRRPLRQDDDLTRQSWLLRRALTCCRTDADCEQLAKDYPGLAEAHAVYTGASAWRITAVAAR